MKTDILYLLIENNINKQIKLANKLKILNMNVIVNGFFKLDERKNYVILDKNKNEVGTLDVQCDPITAMLNEGDAVEFENDEKLQDWFNDHSYMLTADSVRWVEYNPNPDKNKSNDCSIRAYCAAENIEWDEAYDIATKYGKDYKYMPNDANICDKILTEEFGYTMHKFKKEERGKTVKDFAINHPEGIYVLDCPGHLVTVIDGEYYDSWDSGQKKVKKYYSKA